MLAGSAQAVLPTKERSLFFGLGISLLNKFNFQILKWSQKTGQLAKVYPKPMKGYENGEAPEFYRSV
jgi:hypothetical protein